MSLSRSVVNAGFGFDLAEISNWSLFLGECMERKYPLLAIPIQIIGTCHYAHG